MDPAETLRIIIESYEERDRETLAQALRDLLTWVEHGGALT